MNCSSCSSHESNVSFVVFESALARAERSNKRFFAVIIILIAMCACMTYLYVDLLSSIETVQVEQEVETGEGNAYIAGVGDVSYGESPAESENYTS